MVRVWIDLIFMSTARQAEAFNADRDVYFIRFLFHLRVAKAARAAESREGILLTFHNYYDRSIYWTVLLVFELVNICCHEIEFMGLDIGGQGYG